MSASEFITLFVTVQSHYGLQHIVVTHDEQELCLSVPRLTQAL